MKSIVFILMLLFSNDVFSLSCALPDIEATVRKSEDVFVGEIVEIISSKKIENEGLWGADREIIANLRVLEIVRGDFREFQDVPFSNNVSSGEIYLIFNNSAYSSWCSISLSTKLKDAGWYLEVLNFESSTYNKQIQPSANAPGL